MLATNKNPKTGEERYKNIVILHNFSCSFYFLTLFISFVTSHIIIILRNDVRTFLS